jgi:hypothetical protein
MIEILPLRPHAVGATALYSPQAPDPSLTRGDESWESWPCRALYIAFPFTLLSLSSVAVKTLSSLYFRLLTQGGYRLGLCQERLSLQVGDGDQQAPRAINGKFDAKAILSHAARGLQTGQTNR